MHFPFTMINFAIEKKYFWVAPKGIFRAYAHGALTNSISFLHQARFLVVFSNKVWFAQPARWLWLVQGYFQLPMPVMLFLVVDSEHVLTVLRAMSSGKKCCRHDHLCRVKMTSLVKWIQMTRSLIDRCEKVSLKCTKARLERVVFRLNSRNM